MSNQAAVEEISRLIRPAQLETACPHADYANRALSVDAHPKAYQRFGPRPRRFVLPSRLFPHHALFDTEHLRAEDKAPAHGTIRLAHLFVESLLMDHSAAKHRRKRGQPEFEDQ